MGVLWSAYVYLQMNEYKLALVDRNEAVLWNQTLRGRWQSGGKPIVSCTAMKNP